MIGPIFVFLCLTSSFDIGFAGNIRDKEYFDQERYSSEERLEDSNESRAPLAIPKTIIENDPQFEKFPVDNRTDFDGKVQRVSIDTDKELVSNKSLPAIVTKKGGIHAYGLPRKDLEYNGSIERVSLPREPDNEIKSGRLIEAYGLDKTNFQNNGEIERVAPPVLFENEESQDEEVRRIPRSIEDVETKNGNEENPNSTNDPTDLEGQDSKVFRPLFVYRKQQARRQRQHCRHLNSLQREEHRYPCKEK